MSITEKKQQIALLDREAEIIRGFIAEQEAKKKSVWYSIKDFVDGNSVERVEKGLEDMKAIDKEIKSAKGRLAFKEERIKELKVFIGRA